MGELFKKYARVIKFGIVGVINTAVDFIVFTLVSELLHFSPAAAQTAGYCSGIVCSFILNRLVTFSDAKKKDTAGQALRFVIVNGASWVLSTVLIALFTKLGMWKYLAKVIVTGVTIVVNYFGYKILVFRIKDK